MNKKETLKQLKVLKLRPKKSLGQNFLINPLISAQISSLVQNLKPSSLIEIGPGLGSLTSPLSQLNIPLTLVELDAVLARFWRQKKFSVIEKDALQLNDPKLFESSTLVGNLPYQISNRLIIQASIYWPVQKMCLMVQKETAERMLSQHKKKSYGFLSAAVQHAWKAQKKMTVPISDFYPPPQVEGVVLTFQRKNTLDSALADFMKKCFHQKRKILLNKIRKMRVCRLPCKKTQDKQLRQFFDRLNLPSSARAEELSVDQFVKLYKLLNEDSYVSQNRLSQ